MMRLKRARPPYFHIACRSLYKPSNVAISIKVETARAPASANSAHQVSTTYIYYRFVDPVRAIANHITISMNHNYVVQLMSYLYAIRDYPASLYYRGHPKWDAKNHQPSCLTSPMKVST